jgi:hypothetical protein
VRQSRRVYCNHFGEERSVALARGAQFSPWRLRLESSCVRSTCATPARLSLASRVSRSLGLRTGAQWIAFTKSGSLPPDIPAAPWHTYKGKGQAEWKTYCKSRDKPDNIPTHPWKIYAGKGWVSWGDWLGTGVTATRARQYRRFDEARAFARTLALKRKSDWRSYCRSGDKPHDIPARPDHVYSEEGWLGWGDWLGTGQVAPGEHRSFKAASAVGNFSAPRPRVIR